MQARRPHDPDLRKCGHLPPGAGESDGRLHRAERERPGIRECRYTRSRPHKRAIKSVIRDSFRRSLSLQVYTAIEALSDGAVKMGIPRPLATQFAAQTVYGSAKMVLDTRRHPGSLKDDGTRALLRRHVPSIPDAPVDKLSIA